MRKSSKIAYDYALEHADKKSLEKLRRIDCSYQADSWLNDLLFLPVHINETECYGVASDDKQVVIYRYKSGDSESKVIRSIAL